MCRLVEIFSFATVLDCHYSQLYLKLRTQKSCTNASPTATFSVLQPII